MTSTISPASMCRSTSGSRKSCGWTITVRRSVVEPRRAGRGGAVSCGAGSGGVGGGAAVGDVPRSCRWPGWCWMLPGVGSVPGGVAARDTARSPTAGRRREGFGVWLVAMFLHGGCSPTVWKSRTYAVRLLLGLDVDEQVLPEPLRRAPLTAAPTGNGTARNKPEQGPHRLVRFVPGPSGPGAGSATG
jgi:hypothetical protein